MTTVFKAHGAGRTEAAMPPLPYANPRRVVLGAWRSGWALPEALSVSEWAARHRVLPAEGASESGRWRNERAPHLVEIMDCLSAEHPANRVVFMKSTQVGGTECLINALGYYMCHAPGPIMLLVPSLDMAKRHSLQRIGPSIAQSPVWSSRVAKARSREATNSTLAKEFTGGFLVITTANSASGLRSMPVRYLLADEVDEYETNLSGQGDALELAERRTTTFGRRRKIFICSTPTIQGASIIEREYEASDQRRRLVPCPHCDHMQELVIDQLTEDGLYLCAGCGQLIEEHHKPAMLAAGHWEARNPGSSIPGFSINALYAPIGLGDTWREIATKRVEAQRSADKAITFTNCILGLPFASERQQVDRRELESRAEEYALRTVPDGGLVLTAGVDCQHDRFAIKVMAWGRGERGWLVDYVELDGDPSRPDGFGALDEFLQGAYPKRSGALAHICAVFVDGGNWTEEVAKFVRTREARAVKVADRHERQNVMLCRGRSTEGEGRVVYRPKRTETNQRGKTIARSVGVWGVGTNAAKTILFGRLQRDGGLADFDERMLHFPSGLSPEYWQGLTSEYYDLRLKRWVKRKGARNEPVDTLVYAYAAALHPSLRVDRLQEHEWRRLEALLEPAADLFGPAAAPAPVVESAAYAKPARPAANPFVRAGWNIAPR
jgi:phage terminase large subunit GpA-like protein